MRKFQIQQIIVALTISIFLCCMGSALAADTIANINSATAQELAKIPGIGKVMANRIVAYREKHGPFAKTEDIQKIKGIGAKKFEKMKDLITITDK